VRVLFKKTNILLENKNLSNLVFSLISTNEVGGQHTLRLLKKPEMGFQTKIFYHPNEYSLNVKKEALFSFFKLTLQLRYFLGLFSNSHNYFNSISFSKLKRSSFKFRKRKNVYFSLNFISAPSYS
jgi:hypothetical protein